jgi:hypothetical protein
VAVTGLPILTLFRDARLLLGCEYRINIVLHPCSGESELRFRLALRVGQCLGGLRDGFRLIAKHRRCRMNDGKHFILLGLAETQLPQKRRRSSFIAIETEATEARLSGRPWRWAAKAVIAGARSSSYPRTGRSTGSVGVGLTGRRRSRQQQRPSRKGAEL